MTDVAGQTRGGGLTAFATSAAATVFAIPRRAVSAAVAVPRTVLHAVLDEVFAYLADADLTMVLLSAVDFNRILGALDVQQLLQRLDLNAVLADVDLNALLADVDLNALLADVDLNPLLAKLDLNPAVGAIDLQSVIGGLDMNKILEGVDIDAILDRTDLAGVASTVVDEIDLNSIVRDASASVTTEMITDVRSGSERADDRVEVFVNRMLRRKDGDS